jgi:endo-alpha-1,4-polygalactosaminidase (GH114 family)
MGPQAKARSSTKPFTVDENLYFMIAYFKTTQIGDFRVFIKKRDNTTEKLLIEEICCGIVMFTQSE